MDVCQYQFEKEIRGHTQRISYGHSLMGSFEHFLASQRATVGAGPSNQLK